MSLRSNRNTPSSNVKHESEVPMKETISLVHVLRYLKEYCRCSGIHGFRYLSEEHRSCLEKLFWATAIFISTFGCFVMISKIKAKMDTTPMIVTMVENPTKVWHVPFPAVTVCPGSPTRLTTFNLTKFLQLSKANHSFLEDFLNWMHESKTRKHKHEFHDNLRFSDYNTMFNEQSWIGNTTLRHSLFKKLWAIETRSNEFKSIVAYPGGNETLALDEDDMDFLVEIAPALNGRRATADVRLQNKVFWKGRYESLDVNFRHLWTERGLCFTFNMVDNMYIYRDRIVNNDVFKRRGLDKNFPKSSNDWNPDKGGYSVFRRVTYPWRAPHESETAGNLFLVTIVEDEVDIFEYWGKGSDSYMIMFHQPQDPPLISLNNIIQLPFYKVVDMTVKIDVRTTSSALEKYDPQKRQCYYSYEKHLEYFKFYSQTNCHIECKANISLRYCGCVPYYLPRYNTTKICGRDAMDCLKNALLRYDEIEMDAALKDLSGSGKSPFNHADRHTKCDCLPSCLSVSYETDVLATRDLDPSRFHSLEDSVPDPSKKFAPAAFGVRLKNHVFTASQRSEYYGQVDFLANCGGFLGLFCGISILSFIEILYFMTLRLWTNIYRRLTARPRVRLPEDILTLKDPPAGIP